MADPNGRPSKRNGLKSWLVGGGSVGGLGAGYVTWELLRSIYTDFDGRLDAHDAALKGLEPARIEAELGALRADIAELSSKIAGMDAKIDNRISSSNDWRAAAERRFDRIEDRMERRRDEAGPRGAP